MTGRFTKSGRKFEIREKLNGKLSLSYLGREDDPFLQFITWQCDDEAEAMDMVEAIINPDRDADEEYRARHAAQFLSKCKW